MPRQQMRANLWIKLFCFILLASCALIYPGRAALAENEEQADELGEGRIWIPRLAFPPSDPTAPAGYLPLWNRDISIEYLKYTFYLSLAKGLEVTRKESDFYLRLGGRERNITLGLNWYINRRFRLMAEYLWIFCDQNANDDGTVIGGDRPQIFQMRFQVRF